MSALPKQQRRRVRSSCPMVVWPSTARPHDYAIAGAPSHRGLRRGDIGGDLPLSDRSGGETRQASPRRLPSETAAAREGVLE